jgi:uncharacterized protein YndB with AHSA1/START domain
MLRAAGSVVIRRPIEEVFAFVTTPENSSKWQSATVETKKITPGPIGIGTRMSHVGKFMGRRIQVAAAVSDFIPNYRYRYDSRFRSTAYFLRYTFEPVEAGTKLTLDTEANLAGMFRLLTPLVVRMTQRMYRQDLDKMKEVLEG